LHLSALSHWVIYLDFWGAAMDKRALVNFFGSRDDGLRTLSQEKRKKCQR
jgi:hypothetical protein